VETGKPDLARGSYLTSRRIQRTKACALTGGSFAKVRRARHGSAMARERSPRPFRKRHS